eukprot:g17873.t1
MCAVMSRFKYARTHKLTTSISDTDDITLNVGLGVATTMSTRDSDDSSDDDGSLPPPPAPSKMNPNPRSTEPLPPPSDDSSPRRKGSSVTSNSDLEVSDSVLAYPSSDDDDDDTPHNKEKRGRTKSKSPKHNAAPRGLVEFTVVKRNKLGMKQRRTVVVDPADNALRFLDQKNNPTAEFPMKAIGKVNRKETKKGATKARHVHLEILRKGSRPYELILDTEEEAIRFVETLTAMAGEDLEFRRATVESSNPGKGKNDDVLVKSNSGAREYLDYEVVQKSSGLLGRTDKRILVISPGKMAIALYDENRKFKAEYYLSEIVQFEIPKQQAKTGAMLQFVFHKGSANIKGPVMIIFHEADDRAHFLDKARGLNSNIYVKDFSVDPEDTGFEFHVLKINRVGLKKHRIISILTKEQVLRSFNKKKHYKDYPLAEIQSVVKNYDQLSCTVTHNARGVSSQVTFFFNDSLTREKFHNQLNHILHPDREDKETISVFAGTWNMGECKYTNQSLEGFLPTLKHDIYVIGIQEAGKEKDVWMKEMICHLNQVWKEDTREEDKPYQILGEVKLWEISILVKLWEIIILVLIRRKYITYISNYEEASIACGMGNVMGNKGGVGMSFNIGATRLCFIVSHLAAREERLIQRRANYSRICGMKLGN